MYLRPSCKQTQLITAALQQLVAISTFAMEDDQYDPSRFDIDEENGDGTRSAELTILRLASDANLLNDVSSSWSAAFMIHFSKLSNSGKTLYEHRNEGRNSFCGVAVHPPVR
jgi:hypothetical protein